VSRANKQIGAKLILVILLGGLAANTPAHTAATLPILQASADVRVAPPPIPFPSWTEIARTEASAEYEITFPSPIETSHPENNVVPVRALLPIEASGPVPVVVLLHFWGATDLSADLDLADKLNRRGIGAVLVTLPYHMRRAPKGTRSGELAIQPDPVRMVATMTQSVADIRRTIDWIQTRPEFRKDQIGIAGTSLGSIVASLVFAVDSRLSSGAFMLGGVDLAHILWNSSRVVTQREDLRRRGYTEERMRDELKPIEPLEFLSSTERPTLVVGARHDTVIPPVDTGKLIDVLGAPQTLWLETGHYGGVFVQRRLLRTVSTFFEATFAGKRYEAPTKFFAPTIRVGIGLNPATGLQVAAGIDVWQLNAKADGFASLMITPRGFQGYIGYRINQGLSLGAVILPKRATVGVLWSVVL